MTYGATKPHDTITLPDWPTIETTCAVCDKLFKYFEFHDKAQTMPRRKPKLCKACRLLRAEHRLLGKD